jgi:Skp family chaperone for outer membrane proteins
MHSKKEGLSAKREVVHNSIKDKIQQGDSNISQKREEIKNEAHTIRQKGKERGEKGAGKAAWDKTIDTFSPFSKKEE